MHLLKAFSMVVLAVCMVGCANHKSEYRALSANDAAALRDRPLALTLQPSAPLHQFTGADQATMTVGILFGAIGGVASVLIAEKAAERRGRKLIDELQLGDPGEQLARQLRELLTQRYGSTFADSGRRMTVELERWALSKNNDVFIGARVRVYDETGERVVAEGICRLGSYVKGRITPSDAEFFGDDGQGLRRDTDNIVAACAREMGERLFAAG